MWLSPQAWLESLMNTDTARPAEQRGERRQKTSAQVLSAPGKKGAFSRPKNTQKLKFKARTRTKCNYEIMLQDQVIKSLDLKEKKKVTLHAHWEAVRCEATIGTFKTMHMYKHTCIGFRIMFSSN